MKLAICLVVFFMHLAPAIASESQSITVLADASIAMPFSKATREYSAKNHVAVSVAYTDIANLERQAIEGAGYDVLIVASPSLLASLKQQGVVDLNSEATITQNSLVLITSAENSAEFHLQDEFPVGNIITSLNWEPGLLLGNPETLYQGTLGREALKSYGVADDLEPYIIYEKDLANMLSSVANQGFYAIVYATDVLKDKRFRIVGALATNKYTPIEYRAVVLAGEKMPASRQFVEFLKQSDAKTAMAVE